MSRLSKIKEFGTLVAQANNLGRKEIALSRQFSVELLAEINNLLADTVESNNNNKNLNITTFNGGKFNDN
jgi:hypothetical protein